MVVSLRRVAAVTLGLLLTGGLGGAMAQTVVPPLPIVQPVAPTPVTPTTPVPLPTGIAFCDELHATIPNGNGVVLTECQLSSGNICIVGVSVAGLTSTCTNVFVSTPTSAPPTPVPLPTMPAMPTP